MRKIIILFLLLLSAAGPVPSAYSAPYAGYNYDFDGEPKLAPVPYMPAKRVDGKQLGIGSFQSPEDFVVADDGNIYILDTGNNRIVCLDAEWNVRRIIANFVNGGKDDVFLEPQGLFVGRNNHIYVADTGHKRIVELTGDGEFVREIGKPESDVLRSNFTYTPIKVAADKAGRLYVVSKGVFDGLIGFGKDGKFTGFIGKNPVKFDPVELFWKQLATKEQRKRMDLFIPVEFNNVDIDQNGFIYTTTAEAFNPEPVRRLNPTGANVLRSNGYHPPMGDLRMTRAGNTPGSSAIVSVAVETNGIYSVLDSKRGRIFTYDKDGNLMYQFGQLGEQIGTFKAPVEIDTIGDQLVVLDKGLNQLTVFEPTRYGTTIRQAVIESDLGREDGSEAAWNDALKLNRNLEMSHVGIGKVHLSGSEYKAAMADFQLGKQRGYYSKAFGYYRKDWMWNHFGTISTVAIGCIVLFAVVYRVVSRRMSGEPGTLRFAMYTTIHPFKGFWELKNEQKGKLWVAALLLLLLAVTSILKQQFTGFVLNPNTAADVNSLEEITFVLLPFVLWCVANWSLTTLMDGEGKFKEIVIATGYSLIPLFITQLLLIVFSRMITIQEVSFYRLIESVGVIWFVGLLFVGMMTVHQYNVGKTIATMLLTLVVIGVIVFIGLLLYSLSQQILLFFSTVYQEIMFRLEEG